MKKIIIVLIFMALISPVFAQQEEERPDRRAADPFYSINNTRNREENFYYFNVSVEKVYPTKDGYVVQYLCPSSTVATIGIPNDWLANAAGRAEIIRLSVASDWPTMTVFYVDGKFSHVRLYVHPAKSHLTWGNVPQGADVSKFFSDADSFNLQF
ncbi:hypothetical protein [Treponema sp. R80B11-R83G3]